MERSSARKNPTRTIGANRPWARTAALGSFAFVALVVVLLPASAMGGPAVIYHTITITAPFSGAVATPSMSLSTSACGSASLVTAPFFHTGSGRGGFSGTASAASCANGLGGYGSSYQSLTVAVPISVMSGHNRIVEKWSLDISGGTTIGLGKCSIPSGGSNTSFLECAVSTSSSVQAYSYLYDVTNGSYYLGPTTTWPGLSNGTSYYQYCYAGNCSTSTSGAPGTFSFSGALSFAFNAHGLVSTHVYEIETYFYASESVYVTAYGTTLSHAHGTAWLNAGTFGNGIKLDSIVIR